MIAQWVPLYESGSEVVKSELATFFSVFPAGTAWSNHLDGNGYDLVLLGQADPGPIDLDVLVARLNRPDYVKVSASLAQVGFKTAVHLLSTYLTRGRDLAPWLAGAPVNIDRDLRLQYLAGITRELVDSDETYTDILTYRFEPELLITAPPPPPPPEPAPPPGQQYR